MLERIQFYLKHSWNDMIVSKWRTLFALLCISAGVAAVVGLQTLGVMIEHALTSDLQEVNRGDLRIRVGTEGPELLQEGRDRGHITPTNTARSAFTNEGINAISLWIKVRDPEAVISYQHIFPFDLLSGVGSLRKVDRTTATGIWLDSENAPPNLAENLTDPTDIILSETLAQTLDAEKGSAISFTESPEIYTVQAIVADTELANLSNSSAQEFFILPGPSLDDFSLGNEIGANDPITLRIEKINDTETVRGLIIDKNIYPLHGDIETLDGRTLPEAIEQPTDILISDTVAQKFGFKIGDQVLIGGSDEVFTIRGLVEVKVETLINPETAIFGFYYVDLEAVPLFSAYDEDLVQDGTDGNRYAREIYVKLSNSGDRQEIADFAKEMSSDFPYIWARTTYDLEEQYETIIGALQDLLLIMGLVSLLIGGIGIIQTMMVIVARRTTEIAILKTVGLQAQQISILFLVESIMLGIGGSLIGIPFGLGIAWLFQPAGEFLFAQELQWVFDPMVSIRGLVLGVVITSIFGLLPTLVAGQIRPGSILRPSELQLPRAGIVQMVMALAIIFVVLGLVAWSILGDGISPDPNGVWGVIIFGLAFGLAVGIGGAAIGSGLPLVHQDPAELNARERQGRRILLGLGLIVQTILQGILFFALNIIVVVIIWAELSNPAIYVCIAIAFVIGLILSALTYRNQPQVPLVLGAVFFGFIGVTFVGTLLGSIFGLLLSLTVGGLTGDVWRFLVDFASNIILVEVAIIGIGVIIGVLWLIIALIIYLPSFGIPDIKLSLRSLSEKRNRVSTTILALVIGVVALSLVLMLTDAIRKRFSISLEEQAGGNVFIFVPPGDDWQATADNLTDIVSNADGVRSYNIATNYTVEFVTVIKPDGTRLDKEDIIANVNAELARQHRPEDRLNELIDYSLNFVDGRSVTQPDALPKRNFRGENRQLTPEDAGQRRIVIVGNEAMFFSGIEVGDLLVFDFPNADNPYGTPARLKFEVVGITDEQIGDLGNAGTNVIYAPYDSFLDYPPDAMGAVVDIEDSEIPALRQQVGKQVPEAFILETTLLDQLFTEIINRFITLPIMVSILAIFTAGVVIANSVALSTLERQREIGIMKAIGLHRERVLGMLLFENSLMGLLGGIIGVGASVLLLIFVWKWIFDADLSDAIPISIALLLMLGCIVIALIASIFSAWRASGEKPMNVLRYE